MSGLGNGWGAHRSLPESIAEVDYSVRRRCRTPRRKHAFSNKRYRRVSVRRDKEGIDERGIGRAAPPGEGLRDECADAADDAVCAGVLAWR